MAYRKAARHTKLKPEELRWICDPELFESESTCDIKPIEGIIGQERAIKAIKLGVDLRSPGYNIFITGLSGTGKLTTVKKMLEEISPECTSIVDYAYVNNFKDDDRPILLTFPAGQACKFRNDLATAIKFFRDNIPTVLESEPFVKRKQELIYDMNRKQTEIKEDLEKRLTKDNFTLGQVKVGEIVRPEVLAIVDDKPVFVQNLDDLIKAKKITKKKADQILKKYTEYQEELQSFFRKNVQISQQYFEDLAELEKKSINDLVRAGIDQLKNKYQIDKVHEYLDQVEQNIPANMEIFKGQKPTTEETEEGGIIDYLKEYEVNVILDNTDIKTCPVIVETYPTYNNLFGTIEKYNDGRGGWYADFTKIKAGSLLRANNGYLVINAMDAFSEPGVWKTLKRVLLYGRLEIQDMATLYQYSPSVLKPEPIEINTKILFIGNGQIYSMLSAYEHDFNKIFKVKADFDYEMERTEDKLKNYSRVVKKLVASENLLEFDKTALAVVAEYSARYAGDKNKLTTRFAYIADLLRESSYWASDSGADLVSDYHVHQAYEAGKERHGLYESKLSEMIEKDTILIDTEGERIGQINGLAVYGNGQYSFGKPTRITASVSLGNGKILNVEREAGLSGNTHNKGVLIITGYLRETFGKKIPLSFNASLVFEQGYGMIDGDSASITEICALLSVLSGIPIKQNFAITGSVNQKGDIQPIGGVNEKIEGFFDICKKRGLNKSHGVIIPEQNVNDLMLKSEVIEAVKENKFSIYAVSKVEEAVELLTGVKAGKILKSGLHEANTVFGQVEKNLKSMYDIIKTSGRKNSVIRKKPKDKNK